MPKLINENERATQISICLKKNILDKIDLERGLVCRSTYIEFLLKCYWELVNATSADVKQPVVMPEQKKAADQP